MKRVKRGRGKGGGRWETGWGRRGKIHPKIKIEGGKGGVRLTDMKQVVGKQGKGGCTANSRI